MYQFSKVRYADGSWRFELNGISLIVDGFTVKKGLHYLNNPEKAIAFFNFKGNLYGVSNRLRTFATVEALYETMCGQYAIFNRGTNINNNQNMGGFTQGNSSFSQAS